MRWAWSYGIAVIVCSACSFDVERLRARDGGATQDAAPDAARDGSMPADAQVDAAIPDAGTDAGPPCEDTACRSGERCWAGRCDRIAAIGAGASRTAALLQSGRLFTWGENNGGLHADGTALHRGTPVLSALVEPAIASAIVQIADGAGHRCARVGDGQVYCWGTNDFGQLGSGDRMWRAAPSTPVALAGRAMDVVAGDNHACALLEDGRVFCWGLNTERQLGMGGSTAREQIRPVDSGMTSAMAVAAGRRHTCAIRTDGQVFCWGQNADSQVTGTMVATSTVDTPVAIGGVTNATALALGERHSCARGMDSRVTCWGSNLSGQLGRATTSPTPGLVEGLDGVDTLVAGLHHTCALRGATRSVHCWGAGAHGQIGDGMRASRSAPTAVSGLAGVSAIAAGHLHTCATTMSSPAEVQCWGWDGVGQLGQGADLHPERFVDVDLRGGVAALGLSTTLACALSGDFVFCWGRNHFGALARDEAVLPGSSIPVEIGGIAASEPATRLAVGDQFACALPRSGSRPFCWGRNFEGQLGDRTAGRVTHEPRTIAPGSIAVAAVADVSAGSNHACAVDDRGRVHCWGGNAFGQLGDGTRADQREPILVLDGGATALARGTASHTCAVHSTGPVCWGRNLEGQVGVFPTGESVTTPSLVARLGGPIDEIAVGAVHTCARSGGEVYCFGANTGGALGDGTFDARSEVVTVVGLGGRTITQLCNGFGHSCALDDTGDVLCWGAGGAGQLGPARRAATPTPALVEGLSGAASIACGSGYTCAVSARGGARCWGSDIEGRLGSGRPLDAPSPVPVARPR